MTIMPQKIVIVRKKRVEVCSVLYDWIGISRSCFAFGTKVCQECVWLTEWLDPHPSPMWPWLDSASCGFISLVFVLCSERFQVSLVTPVFPHLKNQSWFCLTRFGLSWFLVSSLSRALVRGYTSSNYYCYFCRACQMNVPNCRYTALAVRSSF